MHYSCLSISFSDESGSPINFNFSHNRKISLKQMFSSNFRFASLLCFKFELTRLCLNLWWPIEIYLLKIHNLKKKFKKHIYLLWQLMTKSKKKLILTQTSSIQRNAVWQLISFVFDKLQFLNIRLFKFIFANFIV